MSKFLKALRFLKVKTFSNMALVNMKASGHFVTFTNDLQNELCKTLKTLDRNKKVGAIVLAGQPSAFCAGANIKEMKDLTYADAYKTRLYEKIEHSF